MLIQKGKSNGVSNCAVSVDKAALYAHSLYPFGMTDEAIGTGVALIATLSKEIRKGKEHKT